MTTTLSPGRRWASAIATAALVASFGIPALAFGAPPEHAAGNGKPECINTDPALGEGKTDGNQGNDGANGAVGCSEEAGGDSGGTDPDTGSNDTGNNDTGSNDTGNNDTGSNDTGNNDTGNNDTGNNDTGSNDTGNASGEDEGDPSKEQPAAAVLPGDWCDATTLDFTPGRAGTHEHAVALTAQAFEQGVPGWQSVTWAATDRASVRAVAALRGDDVTILTEGDLSTGTLDEVEELKVCAELEEVQPAPSTTIADTAPEEAEVLGLVLRRNADDPAVTTAADTQVLGLVLPRDADDTAVAATADTQVLGVTLARTGTDLGGLAVAGALGLLAGAGVLLATRRRTGEVR